MSKVLHLKDYRSNRLYSLYDIIFDPQKRQQVYDFYDSKYEETEEEKEILRKMADKRKR